MNIKAELKGVVIHIIVMISIVIVGFMYLFNVYLPNTTNHGETITVPDLHGLKVNEIKEKLSKTSLQFEVIDSSTYNSRFETGSVMNQVPKASSKVKEGRKIYLTVNAREIPLVKFPDLSNKSLRNALIILEASGLRKDTVTYKPYNSPVVIGHTFKGKAVSTGDKLPRGSKVTLVVGLTEGNSEMPVPDLIGRNYKGLKKDLENMGLIMSVRWVDDPEFPQNIVFKQLPESSDSTSSKINKIQAGSIIDVWIAGKKPQELKDSIQ